MKKNLYTLTLAAICLTMASCGKSVSKESKLLKSQQEQIDPAPASTADSIVLLGKTGNTTRIESIVTEEFVRLLYQEYPWNSDIEDVGHYDKTIPNLGPNGETSVYVCIGDGMFDADCFFLLTNSTWDDPDYPNTRDCLALGPKNAGDILVYEDEGFYTYEMSYDIHDSILTIATRNTKFFYDSQTENDTLAGSLTVAHTYSVRYWTFSYLYSDTVFFGDTLNLSDYSFVPQDAHFGYEKTERR